MPSPEAKAIGSFAMNAIISVATAAESAVAVKTAPVSIPAALMMFGCTASMYTIEKKVTTPAINSRGIVDPRSAIPNAYELWFLDVCTWSAKHVIYEKYKDYEDDSIAGHQIRTKVSEWSGAEDKLKDMQDEFKEEVMRNPDRLDFFIF